MVSAIRSLKKEDGETVERFLDELLKNDKFGVAYAIANNEGDIIASGVNKGGSESGIDYARIKAIAAIGFGRDLSDNCRKCGNEFVDATICSGGGRRVISKGICCGSVGIYGRPKPEKFQPCDFLYDSDIAIILSVELMKLIEAES